MALTLLRDKPLPAHTLAARQERMELASTGMRSASISESVAPKAPVWAHELLPVIRSSRLFTGLSDNEILSALPCLGARTRSYDAGEYILHAGSTTSHIFVVLEGEVNIIREDWWGNRNIMAAVGLGGSFAEAYACTPGSHLTVSVVATHKCRLLTLQVRGIMEMCQVSCPFHNHLMQNLVTAVAERNLRLNDKLSFLTQRNTREKILAYLSAESQRQGSRSFTIPFNRQQLADFLSVNRSALSTELSKMKDDGIIDFDRSRFTLMDAAATH